MPPPSLSRQETTRKQTKEQKKKIGIHSIHGCNNTNTKMNQLPVGFIVWLVGHCAGIAEVMPIWFPFRAVRLIMIIEFKSCRTIRLFNFRAIKYRIALQRIDCLLKEINRTRVLPGFLSHPKSKFVTFEWKHKCNRRILYLSGIRLRCESKCGSLLTNRKLRSSVFAKRSEEIRNGSLKLHVRSNQRLQTYLQKLVALKAEGTDEAKRLSRRR